MVKLFTLLHGYIVCIVPGDIGVVHIAPWLNCLHFSMVTLFTLFLVALAFFIFWTRAVYAFPPSAVRVQEVLAFLVVGDVLVTGGPTGLCRRDGHPPWCAVV